MATTASPALERPLCVDLDGTLVKSDTLVDSLLLLVRTRPLEALKAPLWALQGKANLKREVTARVTLNVEHLPYNRPLLEYLMAQRGEGRKLYLATGADAGLADRIAQHLNIFEGVLSSDGATNIIGLQQARTAFATASPASSTTSATRARTCRCLLPLLPHARQPQPRPSHGHARPRPQTTAHLHRPRQRRFAPSSKRFASINGRRTR